MNLIPSFRGFLGLVFAAFFFAWFGLVVLPWFEIGHLEPIKQESGDISPWDVSGLAHAGEKVYAANGCAICHTQQVRAATSGGDLIRGWGSAKDADGKDVTRRTFPRDYIWQERVSLGHSRLGADLSNVGARFADAGALYRYLYQPPPRDARASMPSYRFLFTTRRIDGQPSDEALDLTGPDAPPAGYEVVPTAEARALAAYLLSLRKDYHLPDENGPVPPASDKDKS